jgi:hypothetical protein
MTNAHLRLGRLSFELIGEKRRTSISVVLDRLVAEVDRPQAKQGKAHLLSVVGTDAEIGAISAALSKDSAFLVQVPGLEPLRVHLEGKPDCYKGTVVVPGRNRPLRHLIAISQRWLISATSATPQQVFLLDSSPEFVWTNLAYIYGLPGRPEWAEWFYLQLVSQRCVIPLRGIGCDPVLIRGDRDQFLHWLGQGVSAGALKFPTENGPVVWPRLALRSVLAPPKESETPAPALES